MIKSNEMDADIFGSVLNNIHKFDKILTEYNKYPCFSRKYAEIRRL